MSRAAIWLITTSTDSLEVEPSAEAEERATGFVVVDRGGDVFGLLRSLDLGAALWRVTHVPHEQDLPPTSLVLYVIEGQPSWDEIRELGRAWPTIIIAADANDADAGEALRSGAFGYINARMVPDGLRRTLLGVLRGEPAYGREVLGRWLREGQTGQRPSRSSRTQRLTARQREIIGLIASGATDKEVGSALGIRTATAQKHVANLLRRLGVPNRAAAVGLLLKDGQRFPPAPPRDRRRQ